MEAQIRHVLLKRGTQLLNAPKAPVRFNTGDTAGELLLNDFEDSPQAFVIACLMDRQITAEKALSIPQQLRNRIGTFDFETMASLTEDNFLELFIAPTPLHRFNDKMAKHCFQAIKRIKERYYGNAARIWNDKPSSATLVLRFL